MTRSPAATIRTVADHYGLDVAEITQADHRERGPTAARARRVITYVLRSRGRTWGEIRRLLGFKASSSASRAYTKAAKEMDPLTIRLLGEP